MVDEDMKVITCITNDVQHMNTLIYLGLFFLLFQQQYMYMNIQECTNNK